MRAGCTGPCQQGRVTCPTPEACEIEEPNFYGQEHWRVFFVDLAMACAFAAVAAGLVVWVVRQA